MRDPAAIRERIARLREETDRLPPGPRDDRFREIAALLRELERTKKPEAAR
ncbi:MAG TPA: hypothetical protein VFI25_11295 [Planctomycetota bacterium]|nr:hypothetical protein [Planctomycetota bacterium]